METNLPQLSSRDGSNSSRSQALVPRHRLFPLLDQVFNTPLVCLEAMAGYGKTTLLQQWLLHNKEHNKESNTDIHYVGMKSGLATVGELADYLGSQLELNAGSNESTKGVKPWQMPNKVWLLDDVHLLSEKLLGQLVKQTADAKNAMVVASRWPIHFRGLSKLRAYQLVVSIGCQDIAFDAREMESYFQQLRGLYLTRRQLINIAEKFRGWPVGIQLLADELCENSKTRAVKHESQIDLTYPQLLKEFIVDEVLEDEPGAHYKELIECAPLAQLKEDILTAKDSYRPEVERLAATGIYKREGDTTAARYHYHPAVVAAITEELAMSDPAKLEMLRAESVKALLVAEAYTEAVYLLISNRDWEQAATVVEQQGVAFINSGNSEILAKFLSRLPNHIIDSRAKLLYLDALCSFEIDSKDITTPSYCLDKAEQLLQGGEPSQLESGLLQEIYLLKARLARLLTADRNEENLSWFAMKKAANSEFMLGAATDLGRAMTHYCRGNFLACENALEEAIRHGKEENFQLAVLLGVSYLSHLLLRQGRTDEALHRHQAVVNWILQKDKQHFPEAYLQDVSLVPIYIERHQLKKARAGLKYLLEFADQDKPDNHQRVSIHIFSALIHRAEANYEAFDAELENAASYAVDATDPWHWFFTGVPALRAEVALERGELLSASYWASQQGSVLAERNDFRTEAQRIILARIWVAQGDLSAADALLRSISEESKARSDLYHLCWAGLVRVLAQYQMGNVEVCFTLLDELIEVAALANFNQLCLTQGEALMPIVQQWHRKKVASKLAADQILLTKVEPFVKWLNKRMKERYQTVAKAVDEVALVDPPSEREIELLELLAQGMRNKEIAIHLGLSVSTVKAHLYNSYSKLDVSNRTEAVARARELGLVV